MARRSANAARIFGIILIVLISAWDMDAMRPHIAAHSWGTLALVALFNRIGMRIHLGRINLQYSMTPPGFAGFRDGRE